MLARRAARAARDISPDVPVFVTEQNRATLMAIYDEALRTWPVPFETFFVDGRFGKTHVLASGESTSPPLILIHPMGVGGFVWSSVIADLSEHWRTYALDTIGDVGKSELSDPARYPNKAALYSEWLDDVFAELDISSTDVVAGSMGGWIAVNHAISAPERIRRLVLLGPMGLPSWRVTLGVLGPFLSQRFRPTDAKLETIITRSLGDGERVNRELRPWMRTMGTTKALVAQPLPIPPRRLRMVQTPTLLLLGGKDGLVGSAAAAAKRARTNIRGCAIEVLPNAGHVMSVDEPRLVADRIVGFLR